MSPNASALARQLDKPLVVFDLEHTGSKKEVRGITEFAAIVALPDGDFRRYATLVNPGPAAQFNSYVCELTGIWPETVAAAPGWRDVMHEFVLGHQGSVWVGFNSRGSDIPLVREECLRLGVALPELLQLDLMHVGDKKGSLSARVAQAVPGFDTQGAHRAEADALMTMALLEAELPHLDEQALRQQLYPYGARGNSHSRKPARGQAEKVRFLVEPGEQRRGAAWSHGEHAWLRNQFDNGMTLADMAARLGRTSYAVLCALHKLELITKGELRRQAKAQ